MGSTNGTQKYQCHIHNGDLFIFMIIFFCKQSECEEESENGRMSEISMISEQNLACAFGAGSVTASARLAQIFGNVKKNVPTKNVSFWATAAVDGSAYESNRNG